jgi:hypothetical protein
MQFFEYDTILREGKYSMENHSAMSSETNAIVFEWKHWRRASVLEILILLILGGLLPERVYKTG